MKVIIVKRLPRYDPLHQDPLRIKQSLSEYANSYYDQLWFKKGGPKNIHVVNFDKIESTGYLKDIIYSKTTSKNYDGIHLRGWAATRHFTYRAVEAIKLVFDAQSYFPSNHSNCPQTQYQRKGQSAASHGAGRTQDGDRENIHYGEHSEQVGSTYYNIPVQNRFSENL